ncbi:MAG TPA: hypothetical protein VFU69_03405 [Ktedonobacterales bacterium]|nr:hypothetical protein [Ktedonobacterales bacterium]
MQKWEYCLLSYNSIYKERNFILYYQPGGNIVEQLTIDAVAPKLAELGTQGWELVSAVSTTAMEYYFKRPLP